MMVREVHTCICEWSSRMGHSVKISDIEILYVTVKEKRDHSAQNVHSSHKRL